MPTKIRKTPQQKKAYSYAKDRRNDYGQHDKASRKAIPLRKAMDNRMVRRRSKQDLIVSQIAPEESSDLLESSLRKNVARVGGWKKFPDKPLGEVLKRKSRDRTSYKHKK